MDFFPGVPPAFFLKAFSWVFYQNLSRDLHKIFSKDISYRYCRGVSLEILFRIPLVIPSGVYLEISTRDLPGISRGVVFHDFFASVVPGIPIEAFIEFSFRASPWICTGVPAGIFPKDSCGISFLQQRFLPRLFAENCFWCWSRYALEFAFLK